MMLMMRKSRDKWEENVEKRAKQSNDRKKSIRQTVRQKNSEEEF